MSFYFIAEVIAQPDEIASNNLLDQELSVAFTRGLMLAWKRAEI